MFDASWMTRALVISAQIVMTPVLITTYFIKPTAMHRFVGYLEETAIGTYSNIVEKAETPGTKLHTAWNELPAPDIAKSYWNLSRDATWVREASLAAPLPPPPRAPLHGTAEDG
eukprot:scaffold184_cov316-Pinguiococcus_pyrenoidosus.AAC.41